MDEALCGIGNAAGRGRDDGARFISCGSQRSPGRFLLRRDLTHAELDRLSDRLASWLSERGVWAAATVSRLSFRTHRKFLIAAVAAWKPAAIVVSLNPMYRTPELSKLFVDCKPKVIIWPRRSRGDCLRCSWVRRPRTGPLDKWPRVSDAERFPSAARGRRQGCQRKRWRMPLPRIHQRRRPLRCPRTTWPCCSIHRARRHRAERRHADAPQSCRKRLGLPRAFRAQPRLAHFRGGARFSSVTGFEIQLVTAFVAAAALVLTYRFEPTTALLDAFPSNTSPRSSLGAITGFIALMNQEQSAERSLRQLHTYLFRRRADRTCGDRGFLAARFGRAIRSSYGMTELFA